MTSRETQPAPAGIGRVTKRLGVALTSVPYQLQSAEAALERQERQGYTAAP